MRSRLYSSAEDDDAESQNASFCWWRAAQEPADNVASALNLANLSLLTPRLRLLREMERLNMVAHEGLDELRHKLLTYRAGDFWLRAGGIEKKDMDIPPMISLLLVGLAGSGKSSLVNLMYSVLGRSGLIPFAQTSSESSSYTTILLEEHNVLRSPRSGFCVYDSRGIDKNRVEEGLDEVASLMVNGVRHYQLCSRAGDDSLIDAHLPSARFATRPVNCAIVVADMADIVKSLRAGDPTPLDATRDLFNLHAIRKSNENPILVLTHGDQLPAEERVTARLKICEFLGVPGTSGAYDIPCLTEQGILPEEADPVTSYALSELVYRVLMQADRSHLPKRKVKDWIMLVFSWIMCCIGSFFAMLAYLFARMSKKHKLKMKRR
uniref:Uncharacterized protein n=1 Tax=Kalanchoe fedtschenkoi TaxID=63787 RepID=A0A7N0T2J7_KALFE